MLPEATQSVFDDIKDCPGIEGFLLVGGTALSMRLDHRLSEDLDFQSSRSLDPQLINSLLDCLRSKGRNVMEIPNDALMREFEDSGLEAHYSQRQYAVDGVKLEFFHFIPDNRSRFNEARIQHEPVASVDTGKVRVASLDTIFYLKSLLIPSRSKHRDLFDLLTFLDSGKYSFQDIIDIVREQGILHDVYVRQLLHRKKAADDPGVAIPGQKSPPYRDVVKALEARLSEWEIEQARKAAPS